MAPRCSSRWYQGLFVAGAVNLFGVLLVQAMPASLELTETTKSIAAAYHGILAVLPLVGVFLMTTDRIPAGTSD